MSGILTECLLVIIPELYDDNYGYELGTIWPEASGIHGTEFYCGHDLDLAMEWVNEVNQSLGHTPEFARAVLETISGISKIHFYDA